MNDKKYSLHILYKNVLSRRRAVQNRGLTLIELLVAVAIVAIMIMVFGQILNSSQSAVSNSQTTMRTCAAAAAIEKVIRDDLRKVTQNGFLCITQNPVDGSPRLIAVTSGVTPSKKTADIGNGGIVCLGLCNNHMSNNNVINPANILYHQAWVLFGTGGPTIGSDILGYDLESIVKLPRSDTTPGLNDMNDLASFIGLGWAPSTSYTANSSIKIPTNDTNDINALWQVLASQCTNLSIMWTDGSVSDGSNNLCWYGIPAIGNTVGKPAAGANPDDNYWKSITFDPNDPSQIEFTAGTNIYRALWTKENQSNWPKAIRIRFTLADPALLGEGISAREYEIICPVGQ